MGVGCDKRCCPIRGNWLHPSGDTGQHSLHIPGNAQDINHWVTCIAAPDGHGDVAPDISDDSTDDTVTFAAIYLSVSRFLLQTTADGNCDLDVMCFMLGLKRERQVPLCLRLELVSFVPKHIGNRALVAFMHARGEVAMHIGLYEVVASGAVLLADGGPLHDSGGRRRSSHCDGDTTVRSFSSEEDQAVRWKCRFSHAAPEAVRNVLHALPE